MDSATCVACWCWRYWGPAKFEILFKHFVSWTITDCCKLLHVFHTLVDMYLLVIARWIHSASDCFLFVCYTNESLWFGVSQLEWFVSRTIFLFSSLNHICLFCYWAQLKRDRYQNGVAIWCLKVCYFIFVLRRKRCLTHISCISVFSTLCCCPNAKYVYHMHMQHVKILDLRKKRHAVFNQSVSPGSARNRIL